MNGRLSNLTGLKRLGILLAAALAAGLAAVALRGSGEVTEPAVSAAAEGLPRTYQVQRVDSPVPLRAGGFPSQLASAGDIDGDGSDDFLGSQIPGSPNDDDQVFVISGKTGREIVRIPAPDPGGAGNKANFGFPWVSKLGNAAPTTDASFTDLGSCATRPPNPGDTCAAPQVGAPDGVPEILVGARGVDARGRKDAGRAYVIDGKTFAVLKRIDQPQADTTDLALSRSGGTWFGRTVLNPAGRPGCAGNGGVGTCEEVSRGVEIGDMDGAGRPDIVIGASATTEDRDSAHPRSHCARTSPAGAKCAAAGRTYIYRGEEIVGSDPKEVLDGTDPGDEADKEAISTGGETVKRIKNLDAQADDPDTSVNLTSEIFGNSLTPIGDVGRCKVAIAPGDRCPRDQSETTPDGKAEVVVSNQRGDLPLANPEPGLGDAGASYLVDGATGSVLATYEHPEPQLGATFGAQVSQLAAGNLGDFSTPDVFLGASGQNARDVTRAGRGYVMNGNIKTGASSLLVGRMDDPTPFKGGSFSVAHAGVGDLVGGPETPANELLVGASGSPADEPITDVHFFNAATEKALQSIPDPDQQKASQFGGSVVPLGDLNGDGFLDFAAAAELYDGPAGTDQGRVYILRSDNSPPPPPPTDDPAANPTSPPTYLAGACANRFRGTVGDDQLTGSPAGDLMFGYEGNDTIDGLAADDCLDGGPGNDRLVGRNGADRIAARSGDDVLIGGDVGDRMFGEGGRDRLSGEGGNDLLAGGDANDLIGGGSGTNRIYGETGNDRLLAVNNVRDLVDCGPGRDSALVDRRDEVRGCESVSRR